MKSNNKMILTAGPSITEKEIAYVTDAAAGYGYVYDIVIGDASSGWTFQPYTAFDEADHDDHGIWEFPTENSSFIGGFTVVIFIIENIPLITQYQIISFYHSGEIHGVKPSSISSFKLTSTDS